MEVGESGLFGEAGSLRRFVLLKHKENLLNELDDENVFGFGCLNIGALFRDRPKKGLLAQLKPGKKR